MTNLWQTCCRDAEIWETLLVDKIAIYGLVVNNIRSLVKVKALISYYFLLKNNIMSDITLYDMPATSTARSILSPITTTIWLIWKFSLQWHQSNSGTQTSQNWLISYHWWLITLTFFSLMMNQYYNVLIPTDLVGPIVPKVPHSYQDFAYTASIIRFSKERRLLFSSVSFEVMDFNIRLRMHIK